MAAGGAACASCHQTPFLNPALRLWRSTVVAPAAGSSDAAAAAATAADGAGAVRCAHTLCDTCLDAGFRASATGAALRCPVLLSGGDQLQHNSSSSPPPPQQQQQCPGLWRKTARVVVDLAGAAAAAAGAAVGPHHRHNPAHAHTHAHKVHPHAHLQQQQQRFQLGALKARFSAAGGGDDVSGGGGSGGRGSGRVAGAFDPEFDAEMRVRREVHAKFYRRPENFASRRAYEDYLEEVEELVSHLLCDVNVDRVRARLAEFEHSSEVFDNLALERNEDDSRAARAAAEIQEAHARRAQLHHDDFHEVDTLRLEAAQRDMLLGGGHAATLHRLAMQRRRPGAAARAAAAMSLSSGLSRDGSSSAFSSGTTSSALPTPADMARARLRGVELPAVSALTRSRDGLGGASSFLGGGSARPPSAPPGQQQQQQQQQAPGGGALAAILMGPLPAALPSTDDLTTAAGATGAGSEQDPPRRTVVPVTAEVQKQRAEAGGWRHAIVVERAIAEAQAAFAAL